MTRIAAIVPTRGRALLARRAVLSFLVALCHAAPGAGAWIVVADDSDGDGEHGRLLDLKTEVGAAHPNATLEVLPAPGSRRRTVAAPGGGPGAVRNRALAWLRASPVDHDVTVLFDDDVCFADTAYLGSVLRCDGTALLREALALATRSGTVAGCGYVGRQDLSILEHLHLNSGLGGGCVAPAVCREDVEIVAPAGISTAFLALGSPPHRLPAFPEHYNEDYVWLHALRRAGWRLERTASVLAHAPTGAVTVTAPALSFQVFGEIVWLAVLEQARFPVASSALFAAAIDEIVGDLGSALASAAARARPHVSAAVGQVYGHYGAVAAAVRSGVASPTAAALRAAILDGLALAPAG